MRASREKTNSRFKTSNYLRGETTFCSFWSADLSRSSFLLTKALILFSSELWCGIWLLEKLLSHSSSRILMISTCLSQAQQHTTSRPESPEKKLLSQPPFLAHFRVENRHFFALQCDKEGQALLLLYSQIKSLTGRHRRLSAFGVSSLTAEKGLLER